MTWFSRIRARRAAARRQARVVPETVGKWTRDEIVEAIRIWANLFGEPPRWVDWSPSHARARGNVVAIERWLMGPWPTSRQVTGHFNTWNEALKAAGFEPRPAHRPRKVAVIKPRPA